MALTSEIQEINGSTRQELYDRKIYWWFEDKKAGFEGRLRVKREEERVERVGYGLEWQVNGDMLRDLSWVFCMWEKELYTEWFHLYWANEEIYVWEWYGETKEFLWQHEQNK